jgi:transcriptional regulator with XRE-family HTH domain
MEMFADGIFAEALRRARQRADGISQEDLAERIHFSQAWISKVEKGEQPSRDFAGAVDNELGSDLGWLLDRLLRQAATLERFRPWLDIERKATALRTYQTSLIPGLLQTEGYAYAVFGDRDKVAARMERQAILNDVDMVAVLDAQVLARPVGGAAVMAEQLDRLLEDNRVTVHVVPATCGYYDGLGGAFTMATLDGIDVALLDNGLGGYIVELPDDITRMRRLWESVRSEALPKGQSRAILIEARDRWTAGGESQPEVPTVVTA